MDDLSVIRPTGFYAVNFGDGKTIELAWGVADIHAVKHFVIERYDIYSKKWVAYDGFHGLVTKADGDGAIPPQRITISIDASGEHSFRIKAVGKDNSHSDWQSTSINVTITDDFESPAIYFVQNGLLVTHGTGRTFNVSTGVAYLAGNRVSLIDPITVTVGSSNGTKYLIYITPEGLIGSVESDTTPEGCIRLAEAIYTPTGELTLKDTRFLWAPENLNATWDKDNRLVLTHVVTWDQLDEPNLAGYAIYRGRSINDLRVIQTVEKDTNEYIDNNGLINGATYYYAVSAIDWGNNRSPRSDPPFEIQAGDTVPPGKPIGLIATPGMNPDDGMFIDLSWSPNPEDDLDGYHIYEYNNAETVATRVASISRDNNDFLPNTWRATNVQLGKTYKYAVSAFDIFRNESTHSDIVTTKAGDSAIPSAPTWASNPTTGGNDEEVWVDIHWNPVVVNEDMSVADNIAGYRIYEKVEENGEYIYRFTHDTQRGDTDSARIRYNTSQRGVVKSFVITAYNTWGTESQYSDSKTITLGGHKPKPPVFELSGTDRVIVTWDRVSQDILDNPVNVTRYIIYKGTNELQVFAETTIEDNINESPAETLEWTDGSVQHGKTYYYTIIAIDSNGNRSDIPEVKSITISDATSIEPPDAPTVTGSGTEVDGVSIINFIEFEIPDDPLYKGTIIYLHLGGHNYEEIGWVPSDQSVTPITYRWEHRNNIVNGATYKYILVGVGNLNSQTPLNEGAEVEIVAGDTTKPEAPVIVLDPMWEDKSASIKVSWDPVADVAGFKVYRSYTGTNFAEIITIENGDATEFVDKGLANGATYWYYVKSYNLLGVESDPSATESTVAGDVTGPNKPENLELQFEFEQGSPRSAKIELSWDSPNDADIVGFEIWKSLNGVDYSLISTVDVELGSTPAGISINDMAVFGQHVYYKIRGVDETGNKGEFGNVDKAIVDTIAPDNILFTVSYIQQPGNLYKATLNWDAYSPPGDFGEYRVYTSISSDPSNAVVIGNITDKNRKEFSINELVEGQSYYFGVTCVDYHDNESQITLEEVIVEDEIEPSPPTGLTAKGVELAIELSWTNPTTNVDGSNLLDLKGIEVWVLNDDPEPEFELLGTVVGNRYRDNTGPNVTRTYKIRAFDNATEPNYSEFTDPVTATSTSINDSSFDTTAPDPPSNLVEVDKGTDISETDDTYNVWIEFEWDPSPSTGVTYQIYIDGQPFATTKGTSFRANSLYSKGSYQVYVTALDRVRNESTPTNTITIDTKKYASEIDPPDPIGVTQYFRAFLVRWDRSPARHLAGYELEYYASNDGIRPVDPDSVAWKSVDDISDFTVAIHGRLDYRLYYFYRVRAVDRFDNTSQWAYFDNDGLQPARYGVDDFFANSVYGIHILANEIEGYHVKAQTLTGDHLIFKTLTGDHLQAKAVKTEHLDIQAGGRNFVVNSAFGMNSLGLLPMDGNDIIGWDISNTDKAYVIDDEVEPDIPIQSHALEIKSETKDTVTITQKLNIPPEAEYVSLSFYVKTDSVTGGSSGEGFVVDLYDADANTPSRFMSDDATPVEQLIRVVGNTSWTRMNKVFYLDPSRDSVYLRLILNDSSGTVNVTGIMVEEGDLPTQWYPRDGEVYGASGRVQINSDGIRVTEGRLLIETAHGEGSKKVIINSDGVLAGDSTKYAKMDSDGFVSIGGAFRVISGANDKDPLSITIDSTGIYAYDSDGLNTVKIESSGMLTATGSFSLVSGTDSGNRMEIDSSGLRLKIDNDTKVDISSVNGILLKDKFSIISNSIAQNGFEITPSHIKALDGLGNTTFLVNSATGSVSAGSPFIISSSGINSDGTPKETGSRIVFRTTSWTDGNEEVRPGGIYGYNSGSTNNYDEDYMSFRLLNTGEAYFNGSIHIYSASDSNQISITPQGVFGPGFSLSDGSGELDPGLVVTNAKITQGDIVMDDRGFTLGENSQTGKGIFIKNGPLDIVKIDHEGINIKYGAGLKITGGGTITLGEDQNQITAISATGISASAINTDFLHVKSTGASIKVGEDKDNPDVHIYSTVDGGRIDIFNGKLNVYGDSNGSVVLMQNGKITANALEVGASGSNLLKNGRADFGTESWTKIGSPTAFTSVQEIAEEVGSPKAGVSGENAFKIVTNDVGQGISQIDDEVLEDEIYTLSLKMYVYQGQAKVEISNVEDPDTEDEIDPIIVGDATYPKREWHIIKVSFKRKDPTITVSITSNEATSTIYVTDIVLSEGNMLKGYSPHPSELYGARVKISDGSIKIQTGADSSVVIDETGIHKGSNFALTSAGLSMKFDSNRVSIGNDGIVAVANAADPSKDYVKITSAGLESDGLFTLKGVNDRLTISNTGIKLVSEALVDPVTWVELNTNGLAINEGKFSLKSATSGNRLEMISDKISVFRGDNEIIQIGNTNDEDIGYGMKITSGAFKIESDNEDASVSLTDRQITVVHKHLGDESKEFKSVLDSQGLRFFIDGEPSEYVRNIYISPEQVVANGSLVNYPAFALPPKVLVVPSEFQTYILDRSTSNQYMRARAIDVTENSFKPVIDYYIESATHSSHTVEQGGSISYNIPHNSNWIAKTNMENATLIGVKVGWFAQKGGFLNLADYVYFAVYFDYGSGWELAYNTTRRGGPWIGGTASTGTTWIWSKTVTPRTIKVRVYADINDGIIGSNHVTVHGLQYYADTIVEPKKPPKCWFIAVDGGRES